MQASATKIVNRAAEPRPAAVMQPLPNQTRRSDTAGATKMSSPQLVRMTGLVVQRAPPGQALIPGATARAAETHAAETADTQSPQREAAALPAAAAGPRQPVGSEQPMAAGGAAPESSSSASPGGGAPGPSPAAPAPTAAASPIAGAAPAAAAPQADAASPAIMGQIAGTAPSPEQAQALSQAQLVDSDCVKSEVHVAQTAASRRLQIATSMAEARQNLAGFFTRTVVGVQTLVARKQAEISGAVTQALAWVRAGFMSALLAVQTQGILIRTRINALITGFTLAVQGRVTAIVGQIGGLIDSVPLPDIPGIGLIRGVATRFLNQAANIVNAAFGRFMAFIHAAFNAGMNVLDTFLRGLSRIVNLALSLATAAIMNVVQVIGQALSRAIAFITASMQRILHGVITPLLIAVETLTGRLIAKAQQGALALLRDNRRQYLAALLSSVTPRAGSTTLAEGRATTTASRVEAIRQLGRDALRNNQLIVLAFDLLIGGGIANIIRTLASSAARLMAAIAALLVQAAQAIANVVTLALQSLQRVMQVVGGIIREMLQSLAAGVVRIVQAVQQRVQGAVDSILQFARNALQRIASFVGRLIRSLIGGGTGGSSAAEAAANFSLSGAAPDASLALAGGPITKPLPPALEIIIRLAFGAIISAVSALMVFLFGAELAAIIMGNPVAVVVILLILLVLALLLALLLYLLYRLLKPKPPKPPKRVIHVAPSALELGVGGTPINATATIAPGTPIWPSLTWTINPGAAAPAGVAVSGSGRRVRVNAAQPPHGTLVGGAPITVRAALTANPADYEDSAPVMMVQVLSATYTAAPPLANIPSLWPGVAPLNAGEPNRDTITGNTVRINTTTAPATRPVSVAFRRSLGATLAGTTVTPGIDTGDIGLRISETATSARLDETLPSTIVPTTLMADLTINAVPTKVSGLVGKGALGPYGVKNGINFAPSDTRHPPLTRIVGELITNGGDDFNVGPPNTAPPPPIGFNPTFNLRLAVPANHWDDQLVTDPGALNVTDGRPAIDVNRFVGPAVPQLPRRLIYQQGFQYSSWQGAGTVVSKTFASGQHLRSLIGAPGAFQFRTEHRFGSVAAPVHNERYRGNQLIVLSNIVATPNGPGATALAADGVATASLGVTSSVAGRSVNWSILSGDIAIAAGNPAALPAAATLRAGAGTGNFGVRAADTIYPNRRLDGKVRVVAVTFSNMRAASGSVPSGTLSTTVTLNANPGGRTVNWSVDAAAAAAGVTVTPGATGPGAPPMLVTVTRPAGFTGRVTVTAVDAVLAARTSSVSIRFR
jgi:hypothetical protein